MNRVVSKQILAFGSDEIAKLQVPINSLGCYISFDADENSADKYKAARFWQTGDKPTASEGAIMGDTGYYELQTRKNMENFKIIGIEPDMTHKLMIEYYE